MKYIKNVYEQVENSIDEFNTVNKIVKSQNVSIDEAREQVRNSSLMDYINEADNPFGSFSKPGEKPVEKPGQQPAAQNNLNIDPDELEIGDMVDYIDQRGNKETGKLSSEPDQSGNLGIQPENDGMEQDIMLQDLMGVNDEDLQQELQRLQMLAGIGGRDPEMEESATGGCSGAGAVASGSTPNINPHTRKHSPHGKAYKSAIGKTAEVKRSASKRRPKK